MPERLSFADLADLQYELDQGSAHWDKLMERDTLQALVSMAVERVSGLAGSSPAAEAEPDDCSCRDDHASWCPRAGGVLDSPAAEPSEEEPRLFPPHDLIAAHMGSQGPVLARAWLAFMEEVGRERRALVDMAYNSPQGRTPKWFQHRAKEALHLIDSSSAAGTPWIDAASVVASPAAEAETCDCWTTSIAGPHKPGCPTTEVEDAASKSVTAGGIGRETAPFADPSWRAGGVSDSSEATCTCRSTFNDVFFDRACPLHSVLVDGPGSSVTGEAT